MNFIQHHAVPKLTWRLISYEYDLEAFHVSAAHSLTTAATTLLIGGGGHTGAWRCTGGISWANRHVKASIQRMAPSHPPAISAE